MTLPQSDRPTGFTPSFCTLHSTRVDVWYIEISDNELINAIDVAEAIMWESDLTEEKPELSFDCSVSPLVSPPLFTGAELAASVDDLDDEPEKWTKPSLTLPGDVGEITQS